MENFYLKGTDTTLTIDLERDKGVFLFQGKSRPENAFNYYADLFSWLDEFDKDPTPQVRIHFKLEYFNSSSAKVFLRLMVRFEKLLNRGFDVKILWYYKDFDEDVLETGEDFSSLVDVPFEFYEY